MTLGFVGMLRVMQVSDAGAPSQYSCGGTLSTSLWVRSLPSAQMVSVAVSILLCPVFRELCSLVSLFPLASLCAPPHLKTISEDLINASQLTSTPESLAYCSIGACLLDTVFSWFGCCTGTVITDCAVATGCVASASISACLDDPECYNDSLLTGCTDRASPSCAYLYTVTAGMSFGHFECAPEQTTIEILATGTNVGGDDDGGQRTRTEEDDNGGERTRTDEEDIFSIQTDTVLEDETSLLRPSWARTEEDDSSTEDSESVVTVTRTAGPRTTGDGSSTDPEATTTSSEDAGSRAFRVGVVEMLVAVVVVLCV